MNPQSQSLVDPVCLMTVDLDRARAIGLTVEHEGVTYAFCAKGCKLDFLDSPATYGADPAESAAGRPVQSEPVEVVAKA